MHACVRVCVGVGVCVRVCVCDKEEHGSTDLGVIALSTVFIERNQWRQRIEQRFGAPQRQ